MSKEEEVGNWEVFSKLHCTLNSPWPYQRLLTLTETKFSELLASFKELLPPALAEENLYFASNSLHLETFLLFVLETLPLSTDDKTEEDQETEPGKKTRVQDPPSFERYKKIHDDPLCSFKSEKPTDALTPGYLPKLKDLVEQKHDTKSDDDTTFMSWFYAVLESLDTVGLEPFYVRKADILTAMGDFKPDQTPFSPSEEDLFYLQDRFESAETLQSLNLEEFVTFTLAFQRDHKYFLDDLQESDDILMLGHYIIDRQNNVTNPIDHYFKIVGNPFYTKHCSIYPE